MQVGSPDRPSAPRFARTMPGIARRSSKLLSSALRLKSPPETGAGQMTVDSKPLDSGRPRMLRAQNAFLIFGTAGRSGPPDGGQERGAPLPTAFPLDRTASADET